MPGDGFGWGYGENDGNAARYAGHIAGQAGGWATRLGGKLIDTGGRVGDASRNFK